MSYRVEIANRAAWIVQEFEAVERALNEMPSQELPRRIAKLFVPMLLCSIAALAVVTLWRLPYMLSAVIIALAIVKDRLFPIRFEWLFFAAAAFLGANAESAIIGSARVWEYADWQFANIPVWLPLLWGLVAVALVTMYIGLTEVAYDDAQKQNANV